jgi:DNA-binding transcriptional MerR regulator
MTAESPRKRYHSISEVAEMLALEPYVLRYWETQFPNLRPRKNRAGSRMYQDKDIDLLRTIKQMLHERGYTIAGARKRLAAERRSAPEAAVPQIDLDFLTPSERRQLRTIRDELARLRDWLREDGAAGTGDFR